MAGLMWSGVGVWLNWLAYGWLKPEKSITAFSLAAVGISLAMAIYAFGFSAFANRNILRIDRYTEGSICIFAFQSWTSYPLVAFMISLGIFLRTSALIPKPYLAVMYAGIGGSLFLASFHYYRRVLARRKRTADRIPLG